MVEVGQAAPEFTLPDQEGNEVSLFDFRGQRAVVYCYPKAIRRDAKPGESAPGDDSTAQVPGGR